jgi:8-oxo-dGTP pyrophosphatase MutT (NUDIX family)/GNAT superfamily N-acetyltransferase
MRSQEFVTDEINKQVFSPGWTDETTILNRYVLKAQATDDWNKYQKLDIEVFDPESGIPFRIAHARFRIKPGFFFQKNLEASMIYVSQEYQKRGIATAIYQYVRKLGNTIKPSRFQLPAGKSMWKSFDRTDALAELDEPTRIKLGSSDPAARAWIDRVYQLYPQTFQNNHVMPLGGSGDDQEFAMFELVPSLSRRGAVEVKWFQAYPLRQGVGSRAMQQLQQLAREDGISLTLFPWDKGQVSQSKLTKFYRGQGFSPAQKGSKAMQWTPDQPGVSEGATVTRIDSKPVTDFASGLKAYKHTDDWSQSGLDTGDDSYWKNKNLKTNTTKGLFAGDPRRTALYATGNAHETRYVEFTQNGQPIVYFDQKDLPAMRSRKTYLTVFDASDFKQLPTGEWFSENPGKPIKQMPIGDPFKYIADQGWIVRVTDDLDKVFKQVKNMHKAGKIAQYGAEGMNESQPGVAESTGIQPRAAGCVIVAADTGRWCLQQRSNSVSDPGVWSTWGGGREPGENLQQCVRRELAEESGYQGLTKLELIDTNQDYATFLAHVPREFVPQINHECQDWRWSDPDDLPEPLHPGLQRTLMQLMENFADGKVKGKSRPGRVKRAGASCDGSVTDLRARAKKASGERARMYHWCANMKSGRNKNK